MKGFERRRVGKIARGLALGVGLALAGGLALACGRQTKEKSSAEAPSTPSPSTPSPSSAVDTQRAAVAPRTVEPTRLVELAVSAYSTSLALDDDAVYLLTEKAAYRLVKGEPAQGIALELGIGAVLTPSAFVFWSKGAIWRAPKTGGVTRSVAQFPHQPQYFVASGEAFAWIDLSEDGLYTIQTLEQQKPRVLVSSRAELSALDMIGGAVYFVERPTDASYRFGVVATKGGDPRYSSAKQGRRPATLAGQDQLYYFDLDNSEIRRRSLDLSREEAQSPKLVCSPLHVTPSTIYCGAVEGLFEVDKASKQPRALVYNRPGSITTLAADSRKLAWTVDLGAGKLAVDLLEKSAK